MKLLDLTLGSPAENLALDDALLEEAERAGSPCEVLRIWESPVPVVVVGRSSRVSEEVDVEACRQRGIPVYRRGSGGTSVLIGPGCLMYAIVLSYQLRPAVRLVEAAHGLVLGRHSLAFARRLPGSIARKGISDLVAGDRKFSGNSLRCKRGHLLYHGTVLYGFPIPLLAECLRPPPRQPDYRAGRDHQQFVCNLPLSADEVRRCLVECWGPDAELEPWPREATRRIAQERHARREWIYRR